MNPVSADDGTSEPRSNGYRFAELLISFAGAVCVYRDIASRSKKELSDEDFHAMASLLNLAVRVKMRCGQIISPNTTPLQPSTVKTEERPAEPKAAVSKKSKPQPASVEKKSPLQPLAVEADRLADKLYAYLGLTEIVERTQGHVDRFNQENVDKEDFKPLRLADAMIFKAVVPGNSDTRRAINVELYFERLRMYSPPHEQPILEGTDRFPPLSDRFYLNVLEIATERWRTCESEFQVPFCRPDGTPILVTEFQNRILEALDGKAYSKNELIQVLRDEKIYRRGGIIELMDWGLVKNDQGIGGYYSPDAPPDERKLSSVVRGKKASAKAAKKKP